MDILLEALVTSLCSFVPFEGPLDLKSKIFIHYLDFPVGDQALSSARRPLVSSLEDVQELRHESDGLENDTA